MNGITAYQETAVTTQSKGRLIVLLYDGAIKFMRLAIKELEAGNYAAAIFFSSRAARIADELTEESEWAAAHPTARFVTAHRVNLRSGPSLDERVKQVLPRGTPVLPESEAGDWLLVRTAGGRIGWIHATLVR